MSLPIAYTFMSLVLYFAQMVLAVWKHLQMTNVIMLDFSFYRSPRKSILGEALVLGLHLDVVGAGIGPEGPGSPETPSNKHYDHA